MYVDQSKVILLNKYEDYSLTEEDYKNIFCSECYLKNFIKKDGIIYHERHEYAKFKNCLINELICEEVAKYLRVQTVDSFPATYDTKNIVLLSKIFTNKNQKIGYITDFNVHFSKDVENLKDLSCYSLDKKEYITLNKKCKEKLIKDLKKMIICDFITCQTDRHENNFSFSFDKKNVQLLPLFDYELSFFTKFRENDNFFQFNLDKESVLAFVRNDKVFQYLLTKIMNLNIEMISEHLIKKGIYLNSGEKYIYGKIIDERKNTIKEKRLIIKKNNQP